MVVVPFEGEGMEEVVAGGKEKGRGLRSGRRQGAKLQHKGAQPLNIDIVHDLGVRRVDGREGGEGGRSYPRKSAS